ncbi:MAG: 2,3-bisphosphoglycerate-independent phosphoglycerate mutase [bacterium]|nr:2,3-bisphosphoglycerate-independent phosphoglycerate mutase [bacterium]
MHRPPLLLIVLDGWGHRVETEANAIVAAAPYFAELEERFPSTLLTACGKEVGLPLGVMGNSEVGHMNLGAGRVVPQDVSRIDRAVEDAEFFDNGAFVTLIERLRREGKALHLFGLVSDGCVHSSDVHLRALLQLAARLGMPANDVFVHVVTDGRDTAPNAGVRYVESLEADLAAAGVGRIASVVGRYYAMDRDKRWPRVERAYDLLTAGAGERAASAGEAVRRSYDAGVTDEFIEPCVIGDPAAGRITEGDGVIAFNFRSDRMRQVCMALGFEDFADFERKLAPLPEIATMTQYRADFPFAVAFPPRDLAGTLPELVSAAGLRQKRIAETEKYAHVTFFFSGGREEPLPGEERILVPSPKVATYDLQPEMSAQGVTDAILDSLQRADTDVYIINFANSDMVGHTGDFEAAKKAVATVDGCLRKIVPKVLERGGTAVITADHGNSEQMWDPEGELIHTAHTLNPVPLVICGNDFTGSHLRERGILADVAPTLLEILKLERSEGMDGHTLFA